MCPCVEGPAGDLCTTYVLCWGLKWDEWYGRAGHPAQAGSTLSQGFPHDLFLPSLEYIDNPAHAYITTATALYNKAFYKLINPTD